MSNESTYFKFELYTIHVGSINSFGGRKVPIYWHLAYLALQPITGRIENVTYNPRE